MSHDEIVAFIRKRAAETGITTAEWARRFNNLHSEEIARAMESLPTDVLEVAVKFEALSHPNAEASE
jgi:hypothetical protein